MIKFGLEEIPPLTFAGLRYSLAALILSVTFVWRGGLRQMAAIPRQDLSRLLALGLLLYAVTQGAVFVALAWLPAITVNLLWSFSTILVGLIGVRYLAEKPSPTQWLGVALAAGGAAIYFGPEGWPTAGSLGLIAAGVGVLANASASVLGRHVNRARRLPPLTVTAISMAAGSLPLLLAGLALEATPAISPGSWLIILWLAVINTALAFTLWNATLKTLTAVESSVINGTMMVWIPLLAVAFLGEQAGSIQIAGLVLAGTGTFLVQLGGPRRTSGLAPGREAGPGDRAAKQ